MIRVVDRPQRILITDAGERVRVAERHQRILIGPTPVESAPEPPPDYFYGVAGGLARYDARTLGLADGAPVAAWGDVSGQVGAAVQDVEARQPAYVSTVPGVRFPGGAQHHLRMPSALQLDARQPFTLVTLVTREVRSPPTGQLIGWGDLAGQAWGLYQLSLGRATWLAGGNQRVGVNDAWPVGLGVVTLQLDGMTASAEHDGDAMGTPIAIGDVAMQPVVPSMGAQLDAAGGVDFPFVGIVHDLLFFNRALSPTELATLRAELTTDWGI